MTSRTLASWGAMILGVLLIIGSVATWILVSSTLAEQKIVTSEDAVCLPNTEVDGPFAAYCQAETIDRNVREITGGLTYAELPRDDERRDTASKAAFLQASLFTSILAFGVSAMALGMGVIFVLIGLGMRDVKEQLGVAQRQ